MGGLYYQLFGDVKMRLVENCGKLKKGLGPAGTVVELQMIA